MDTKRMRHLLALLAAVVATTIAVMRLIEAGPEWMRADRFVSLMVGFAILVMLANLILDKKHREGGAAPPAE